MSEYLKISKYKVMKSAAGYYVGRTCTEATCTIPMPYDRATEYFQTKEEAEYVYRECFEPN